LDVGCGVVGSGDVNCDLYVNDAGHRLTGNVINTRYVKNFVCCDAQYLPFKDEAFDWVYSSHVIEHVDNPFAMLREMVRVARIRITVRCPHRLGDRFFIKRSPYHVNFFGATWFKTDYSQTSS
jgi:predicted SAM-dependent methyltransferase